jgi:predicted nucleotide-binding protein
MTIIVEDGTVVTGANSYVTLAEFKAWADARDIDYGTDAEVTAQLYRAMDYLESLNYKGTKANESQELQWPRHDVCIDTYTVSSTEIPSKLKNAQYEAIKAEIDQVSAMANLERQTTSETVGDISVNYATGSASRTTSQALSYALRKLVTSTTQVTRA